MQTNNRRIRLTSHLQANQFPQIIQDSIKRFNTPFITIRCWSTLPKRERDNIYIYIYIFFFFLQRNLL